MPSAVASCMSGSVKDTCSNDDVTDRHIRIFSINCKQTIVAQFINHELPLGQHVNERRDFRKENYIWL